MEMAKMAGILMGKDPEKIFEPEKEFKNEPEEQLEETAKGFNVVAENVKILKSNILYDGEMDKECIPLCNAMNAVKGIITTESCCGHGKAPFEIFFKVTSFKGLFFITRCIDRRYFKYGYKWTCEFTVGDMIIDGILPTSFYLHSEDVGEEAYKQANDLVKNMNWHLNHKNFMKGFGLDLEDFEWE